VKLLTFYISLIFPFLFFGQTKIKSFYFDTDQSVPTEYSKNQLLIFKRSFDNKEFKILEIYSYTDSIGSVQYNDTLAKKRLKYVTNFLEVESNSTVLMKPYGLDRKYDVTNYKSWRRVDIYYSYEIKTMDSAAISSDPVDTAATKIKDEGINENIELQDEEMDFSVPYILNIEFIEGTARIEKESYPELSKMVDYLNSNPSVKILIRGHVCCGNNLRISKNRARAIYRKLIKMGISDERLDYIGISNKEPLVFPEKTNADRQRNRRVDIKFIEF
jgi:outer membrane protein OmpA-like peptidoglycan-associated protein